MSTTIVEGISLAKEQWPVVEGTEVMTRNEASKSRKPGLRDKMCRIYWCGGLGWWTAEPPDSQKYGELGEASYYKMADAIGRASTDNLFYIDIVDSARKCRIDHVIPMPVVAMIKVAPQNSTFRAKVLSVLGEPIPDEHQTYEQIKDWVEMNFPREGKAAPAAFINIPTDVSEHRYGRCRYSVTAYGRRNVHLTHDTILKKAAENDDIDDVMSELRSVVLEDAQDNTNLEDGDDFETTDCEVTDSDGIDVTFNDALVKQQIIAVLKSSLSPDDLERLGL